MVNLASIQNSKVVNWIVRRCVKVIQFLTPPEHLDAKADYWFTDAGQEVRSAFGDTFEVRAFDVWHKEQQLGVVTLFHNSKGSFASFNQLQ